MTETQRELARIERKIDARLRQLQEAQAAPPGEIQLVLAQACRLTVAGFSREIAIIDHGFTHDRDKFITEICIPVKKQEPYGTPPAPMHRGRSLFLISAWL